jgi:hypothetical protein
MPQKTFNFSTALEKFEAEYRNTDPRTAVLQSNQQKIIYTFVRTVKSMTLEDIIPLYKEKERAKEQIMQMIFYGFIRTENEEIFYYVKYKENNGEIQNAG